MALDPTQFVTTVTNSATKGKVVDSTFFENVAKAVNERIDHAMTDLPQQSSGITDVKVSGYSLSQSGGKWENLSVTKDASGVVSIDSSPWYGTYFREFNMYFKGVSFNTASNSSTPATVTTIENGTVGPYALMFGVNGLRSIYKIAIPTALTKVYIKNSNATSTDLDVLTTGSDTPVPFVYNKNLIARKTSVSANEDFLHATFGTIGGATSNFYDLYISYTITGSQVYDPVTHSESGATLNILGVHVIRHYGGKTVEYRISS